MRSKKGVAIRKFICRIKSVVYAVVSSDMKGLKIHRDIGIDIVIPYVAPMFQGHKDILLRHR